MKAENYISVIRQNRGYFSDLPIEVPRVTVTEEPLNANDVATKSYVDSRIISAVSVKDYGAVGDGIVDDTAAFNAAMATSSYVIVPKTSHAYLIKYLSIPTKTTLVGQGRPQINLKRNGSQVISRIRTLCTIDNLYINSLDDDLEWNRVGIESATNVVIRNCRIDGFRHNNPLPNSWGLFIDRSSYVRVENCIFDNNSQSDIAIVDQCSHIDVIGCKGANNNLVINIEPNASFISSKIRIENCRIQKAMSWDYSDIANPIDNAVFKDCVIDLFRYAGGNVIFDNTAISSFEAVSVGTVGNRGGTISNINSFGLDGNINPDPSFHKIASMDANPKLGWTFFYSPDGNTLSFKNDEHGRYLCLNPNGIDTTVSVVRQFDVQASQTYCVRSLLSVYYPAGEDGTYQFAIEYYDQDDEVIGERRNIIVDKRSGRSEEESEWDEKSFFFNTPALCTSVRIYVFNTPVDTINPHILNIQYLLLNRVLLNARNYSRDDMNSYMSAPPTSYLTPVGTGTQSIAGQRIYSTEPGTLGYEGWMCVASGNPGTWKKFGALVA